MIPVEDYKKIIASMPILCIDIIIENQDEQYLLLKRANEPLKGDWWVIGGRVLKGETLMEAAIRKLKEEVGIEGLDLRVHGIYEDFFDKNALDVDSLYHTVSVVFKTKLNTETPIQLDSQSHDWKYSKTLPERLRLKNIH
jgi:colanic acid biosynthesis protein WcaH